MVDSIIGIDCATQPRNVGLARAVRYNGSFRVTDLIAGSKAPLPIEVVLDWLGDDGTALLALDAPLGWPSSMQRELAEHVAGEPIAVPSELLFRRFTDRVVADRVGKTPLDVGADRIARTAHWALLFLDHIRAGLKEPVPLAWDVPLARRVEAIEVYPAATLLSRSGSLTGYKRPGGVKERARLFETVSEDIRCESVRDVAVASAHCLDALACVLAGLDFLTGVAVAPPERDVARREGWIWFKEPDRRA